MRRPLLHYFYEVPRSRFRTFMDGSLILVRTMRNIFLGVRGLCLALLILAAIGRANLHTSIAGSGYPVSGLGRLGRDLVRRENRDGASSPSESAESSIRPTTSISG
jgi:hypothetical protein